jgi:peptidyl-dipeptidase Dcp
MAEIEAIANDPEANPRFDNTIVAMEKSGAMLKRAQAFQRVTGANTDDTLQKVQEEEAPKLAAHRMRSISTTSCSSVSRRCTTSAPR